MRAKEKSASAAELRNLSRDELTSRVSELKEELFGLRFSAATGQLESHGRLRAARKDIARIYTVLNERDPDADDIEIAAEDTAAEETSPAGVSEKPKRRVKEKK